MNPTPVSAAPMFAPEFVAALVTGIVALVLGTGVQVIRLILDWKSRKNGGATPTRDDFNQFAEAMRGSVDRFANTIKDSYDPEDYRKNAERIERIDKNTVEMHTVLVAIPREMRMRGNIQ